MERVCDVVAEVCDCVGERVGAWEKVSPEGKSALDGRTGGGSEAMSDDEDDEPRVT